MGIQMTGSIHSLQVHRPGFLSRFSTPFLLAVVFASAYLAIGPGCFFSVDEVVVEEMAQAVFQRGTLEIPAMNTAIRGRGGAFYAHRGPALGYIAWPLVAAGSILDNKIGSLQGGIATGSPLGTLEQPLRWGGRLSIFAALVANAIIGGLTVAIFYLIALRMGVAEKVALAFACSTGIATLLASESTHFFQHPLEALSLLCGFWFLSSQDRDRMKQNAWLGGLSLGLAVLARPNGAPAAAVIWLYGIAVAGSGFGYRDRSAWFPTAARSAVGPAACAIYYFLYNYAQYGDVTQTGYGGIAGIFDPSLSRTVRATAAYLWSPALSVFLFAPLLLLIPFVWRESHSRWPLKTKYLLLASIVHFVPITFLQIWDGAISYGPRYALVPMLLLLPLSLPAFEKAFQKGIKRWRNAVGILVMLGVFVQVVGVSVYVATNEWYYKQQSIYDDRAFVFIPSASPVWLHLRHLVAGTNIIPWALRVVSEPGPALVLLAMLLATIGAGIWLLSGPRRKTSNSAVPGISIMAMSSLVLIGFFATSPVVAPLEARIVDHVQAGLAAQEAGHDVEAEELYALVLGLDPANKYALHNLALLYEKAGKSGEARSLYQRAVESDPAFTPSIKNLARYSVQKQPQAVDPQSCGSTVECYEVGKRFWDSGDKAGALRIWERARHQFLAEAWLLRDIARSRYDLGDYKGAVRDYREALALTPSDNGIRTDLAWALLSLSHFDKAREICNEVLAQDNHNAAARAILSRLP